MLVVRRRAGEALLIGDAVEIEILEIAGSQVKVGIRAPREITVLRKEIRLTADQNRAAARLSAHKAAEVLDLLRSSRSQIEV